MTNVVVDVLLAGGVLAELVCCLGLAVMRTTSDRLHYASAGYTVGPFLVVAALLVREGLGAFGLDALAVAVLLFLPGPILVHATARVVARSELERAPLPEQHL